MAQYSQAASWQPVRPERPEQARPDKGRRKQPEWLEDRLQDNKRQKQPDTPV